MTFIGLVINQCFHAGRLLSWAKAAAVVYAVGVPRLVLIVPPIRRFVLRYAAV